ncbi:hypothetical protein K2173_002917 [Erythroxylum novogranatense]|uniref:Peptide N-acetyl-beta-D-glucosaminyl asparaginase amidase A N-terminal domain-containing protein n=1 Tax=Erythroxylum novogranatense TaxID=1862640 RepID=A0AAV8TR99_9ROSI|nr:hypothetical protein K2173_002917 [Erythroxylum novogranatense]
MHAVFVLMFLFTATPLALCNPPDRFFRSSSSLSRTLASHKPQKYFEVARPLPSDHLTPSRTLHIIHHSFANTIDHPPFTTPYSPPSDCPSPWSHVTLEFHAKSRGDQYDRISGLWLGGVELLRTSTAEPTQNGVFWTVRKDITRYSSVLSEKHLNFTMMLENIINSVYTGIYHVDVKIFFYKDNAVRFPLLGNNQIKILNEEAEEEIGFRTKNVNESPADLIIPISSNNGINKGYWFVIKDESDIHFKKVRFPNNARKVVLELYVSFHGNDEFWYSNPSNSYIRVNNLTTLRGNGAYREVFVTIDGKYVASEVPSPVVFTGGINPLLWEPVVAMGAFNLPSYDFDLTPFLGMVLDGKKHEFGIGVNNGISYWLVNANLHIWVDHQIRRVEAKSVDYYYPSSYIRRSEEFQLLDGSFEIKGKRRTRSVGWVISSSGNLTTLVSQQFKFRNLISFGRSGTYKYVKQRIKSKKEVKVFNEVGSLISRAMVKRRFPLKVITLNLAGSEKGTYMLVTNVSLALKERHTNGEFSSNVYNKQDTNGRITVKGHEVLSGEARTNQTLSWFHELGCYIRIVAAFSGRVIRDDTTYVCPSVM